MAPCSAPSSPLTPLSFISHKHLGTSKPPNSGRLTLTNTARIAKPVPEAHRVLKCLCVPSQQHHGVIPSQMGGGPSWNRNAHDQDPQAALLETQQSSLSQGLSQKGTPIKEGTLHFPLPSLTTTTLLTALPQREPDHPARDGQSQLATPCTSGMPRSWEPCPKAVPSCERARSFPACSPKTSPTFLLN